MTDTAARVGHIAFVARNHMHVQMLHSLPSRGADIDAARRIMQDISGAQPAAEHSEDGSHDLPGPSR